MKRPGAQGRSVALVISATAQRSKVACFPPILESRHGLIVCQPGKSSANKDQQKRSTNVIISHRNDCLAQEHRREVTNHKTQAITRPFYCSGVKESAVCEGI